MPEIAPDSNRGWLRPNLVSSWSEFLLVATLLLVLPIRNSTMGALAGSSAHFVGLILSNDHMLRSIIWESLQLAIFFFYLHWRGWRPADFRIGISWLTSLQALGLLVLGYIAALITLSAALILLFATESARHSFLSILLSISPHLKHHSVHVSWLTLFPAMIINGYLEELTCMGYIFNQFAARSGPVAALVATVFLRMACHTYQDPIHLAGIGALFTVYGVWYWKGRKLWPLILAHILLDLISCSVVKHFFG